MNISGENLIRIGLVVGGLLLSTGGTLGTQALAPVAPKPSAQPIVSAEVGCLEIRIPLDKVKIDRVKNGK